MSTRILHVLFSDHVGGSEKYLLRFCDFVRKNRDDVEMDVMCFGGITGTMEPEFKKVGINLISFKMGYINPVKYFQYYSFLRRKKYDAVCSFLNSVSGTVLWTAKMAGVKKRINFYRSCTQNSHLSTFQKLYLKMSHYLITKSATHLLSNSQTAFDLFFPNHSFPKSSKTCVIRNGIDVPESLEHDFLSELKAELGIPDSAHVVGHVGNFRHEKNHQLIVRVAEKIFQQREDVYFLLCGRDVPLGIQKFITDKKYSSRIIAPGVRSDIFRLLKIMDVFIFPSFTEGQPNALLEALCLGIPFVASNFSSIAECIPEEYKKFLFDPHDTDGFTKSVLEILDHPWSEKSVKSMVQNIREFCDSTSNFNKFLEVLAPSL